MVLDFLQALPLLELFLIVVHNMSWLRRLPHVDARLHVPESLHMHDVFFDLLAVGDESIGS